MLEESRIDQVGHHADSIQRRVESPAMNAPMPGPIPASAPTSRMMEPQRHSPAQHAGPQYRPNVEELYNQLQSQLHVHSNILEEQRHHIERLDGAVSRLQQEQNYIFNAIRDVKNDLAARPHPTDAPDLNEIDILTDQLRSVTGKVNEVEGLKLELMSIRRSMRRLERHGSPAPSGLSSVEPLHDHAHPPPAHKQSVQAPYPANTPSAPESRPILYQTPSDNRLPPPVLQTAESRDSRTSSEGRTLPSFRSIDPASANSSVSGWRPAGSYAPGPPPLAPQSGAPTSTPQAETPVVSGWAAVNASSAPKRTVPVDPHPSAFEGAQPGSPKRQRLAPLMPRVNYEQNAAGASSPYQPSEAISNPAPPVPSLANSRNPSSESAVAQQPNPLRFVLSTQDASSEESWRHESQRPTSEAARGGRASPRRGRGGGRGRGRKSGGPEERGTPEWEQPEWTGSQAAPPNGYYQPAMHPQDPSASRGNIVRRGGGHAGAPSDHAMNGPPIGVPGPDGQHQHVPQASLYPDPHFMPITTTADVATSNTQNASNPSTPGQSTKKTRTKPVRNADGVLIRKDGRPDMRSVSSAMNLKKVHAKKEAERQSKEASEEGNAGGPDGGIDGTPRSSSEHELDHDHDHDGSPGGTPHLHHRANGDREGRDRHKNGSDSPLSQPPSPSPSPSDMDQDEDEERHHASHSQQDKHAANMRKIFPYGIDGGGGVRHMGQAFFPPAGADDRAPPGVKIETAAAAATAAAAGLPPLPPSSATVVPSRESGARQVPTRGIESPAAAGEKAAVGGDSGAIGAATTSIAAATAAPDTTTASTGDRKRVEDVEMAEAGT